MKRLFAVLMSATALVLLTGCEQTQTVDASNGAPRQVNPQADLVAQSAAPIPDVPLPLGFKLDESVSRNYSLAGARLVDHVYKGSAGKFALKRFYERQMPVHGWTTVSTMFTQGQVRLYFMKDIERCAIVIADGGLFGGTRLQVDLHTEDRLPPPPAAKR
jgi:hypothetical protein